MGFLAKLLAPHVGAPEQASASASSASSSPASQIPSTTTASTPPPQQQQPIVHPPPAPPRAIDTSSTAHLTPLQRQVKQLGLLALGCGFMAATVAVTRRAVVRRQMEAVPRFFHSSYLPAGSLDSGERSALAAQALGLATLNVAGFGVLLVGGAAWSFDLCSVAELQARTQMALRRQGGAGGGSGLLDEEEEREVDNMVMGLMEKLGMDVEDLKEKDRLAAEQAKEEATKA
ncbi:hypothetical protein PWT90_03914 [Aphanocladium album]|nr:hypothetical protein PWT90_03914 [Aphanocladium album]